MNRVGDYVLVPPFVSFPLLLFLGVLRNAEARVSLPAPLWGLFLLAYLIGSIAYGSLLLSGKRTRLLQLQLFCQGLLVAFLSLAWGTPALVTWAGVASVLVALLLSLYDVVSHPEGIGEASSVTGESGGHVRSFPGVTWKTLVERTPLPVLVTDKSGAVQSVSPAFADLYSSSGGENLLAQRVERLLPLDKTEVILDDLPWEIEQVFFPEEEVLLFFLVPPRTAPEPAPVEDRRRRPLRDERTGLYNEAYLAIRGMEELSRDARYKRWLSAVMFKVNCAPGVSEIEEKLVVEEFAKNVRENVRGCDIGFFLDDRSILLMLPETPLGGAQILAVRLGELFQNVLAVQSRMGKTIAAELLVGLHFYRGTEPLQTHSLVGMLQQSLRPFQELKGHRPQETPGE